MSSVSSRFLGSGPMHNRPHYTSAYIRARGQGEQAVRAVFAGATVIRPAVMFGTDDAFLNTLIKLLRRLPVYPMFGRGKTQLQPADVRLRE